MTSTSDPQPVAHVRDADGFADVGSYALLGDGRSVVLVALDGQVDWWAVPRLDGPPVFSGILDPANGGRLVLRPSDPGATAARRYLPKTNVLETTWQTSTGTAVVTEALTVEALGPLPWVELARRVEGVSGTVEMTFEMTPGDGLGAWSGWTNVDERGVVVHAGDVIFGVVGSGHVPLSCESPTVRATFETAAGRRDVIGVTATFQTPVYLAHTFAIDRRLDTTVQLWQTWSDRVNMPGPDRYVGRSALFLRMLMMSETGAIAAAATTSLPERIGGPKNWDYRFAWVRDAALTIGAMMLCGLQVEAQAAVSWLLQAIRRNGPGLHVMYTLDGEMAPGVSDAEVPGYRGSLPVRIGNDAVGQLQLGVFGDLFGTLAAWIRRGHVLDVATSRELADLADQCADQWRHEDSGIWELPRLAHYTSSKMNCWRALILAAELAEGDHIQGSHQRWRQEADHVRAWIEEHCWSESKQAYSAYAGSDDLDASVLLGATFGYECGPRMASTIDAISAELGADTSLLYRYSGVAAEEETFLACAFWRVAALVGVGRHDEAVQHLDELETLAQPLWVLPEMIKAGTNDLVGNTPQALSHLAYIGAVAAVNGQSIGDEVGGRRSRTSSPDDHPGSGQPG